MDSINIDKDADRVLQHLIFLNLSPYNYSLNQRDTIVRNNLFQNMQRQQALNLFYICASAKLLLNWRRAPGKPNF